MNAVLNAGDPSPLQLPVLHVEVSGKVTASNLNDYRAAALKLFSSINTDLQTDADFSNADLAVKWCGDIEDKLQTAKQRALEHTADIKVLFETINEISEQARQKRLQLEKLIKAQKETVRNGILLRGKTALTQYVHGLEAQLTTLRGSPLRLPAVESYFDNVVKGRRSMTGIQEAVNAELVRCQNEAQVHFDTMKRNLATYNTSTSGLDVAHLFRDLKDLLPRESEGFKAIVVQRVSAEQVRIEQVKADAAAAERKRQEEDAERQRKEEAEKTERQQREAQAQPAPAVSDAAMTEEGLADIRPLVTAEFVETQPAQVVTTIAPSTATTAGKGLSRRVPRPTDALMVSVLAARFDVSHARVVSWLSTMDLTNPDLCAP